MTHKTQHTGGGTSAGNRGWIKLHRSLLSWEWYSNINVTRLFIHLLLKAGRETTRWQGHELPRGSFVTSTRQLATETGLTHRETRTCLDLLATTGEVKVVTTRQFSIVIVCKYDTYQPFEQADRHTADTQNDTPTDTQPTHKTTQSTNNRDADKSGAYEGDEMATDTRVSPKMTQQQTQKTATIQEYNKKEERKKNNNNLSLTHACEERNLNFDLNLFLDQYFSRERESMIQGVATSLGFKDSVEMRKAATAIVGEWRASETGHRDFQDAASHLQSLLRLRRDEREREKRRAAAGSSCDIGNSRYGGSGGSRYGGSGSRYDRSRRYDRDYKDPLLFVNDKWNDPKYKAPKVGTTSCGVSNLPAF